MVLNYSKIKPDGFSRPVPPTLLLQTLDGVPIGTLCNVSELHFAIKYAEPSELTFEVAAYSNG